MGKRTLTVLLKGGSRGLDRKTTEYMVRHGNEVYVFDKTNKSEFDPS
jgi:hypothetical protein